MAYCFNVRRSLYTSKSARYLAVDRLPLERIIHVVIVGRSVRSLARRAYEILMTAHQSCSLRFHLIYVDSMAVSGFADTVNTTATWLPHQCCFWKLMYDATPDTSLVRCRAAYAASMERQEEDRWQSMVIFVHACVPESGWDTLCWDWMERCDEGETAFVESAVPPRRKEVLVAWPSSSGEPHFPTIITTNGLSRVQQHRFAGASTPPSTWYSCLVSSSWMCLNLRQVFLFPFEEGILGQTIKCLDDGWHVVVSDSLACLPASTLKIRGNPLPKKVRTQLGSRAHDHVGLEASVLDDLDSSEMIVKYGSIDEGKLRISAANHAIGASHADT